MTIECPKCQTNNPDSQKFCGECATSLEADIEVSHTKTLETPIEEMTRGSVFAERYEIIEELGKGGMGKVYRVLDKELNEEVALKLIKPEIATDKKTVERFKSELKLARKISHKNICRMYELLEEKGTRFITMEYVPGEDLRSFIRRSGQLAVGTTIRIAKQVCKGMAEAHRLGVIHRDLKPSNIMIDKEGNARIMDFGIARSLEAKGITGVGIMVGTPEYMSPEQAEVKEVDQRSDIYSLGVILYEMVTGRVPFEGENPLGIAMKHKSEMPKDPKEINPQIPDDLSHVVLRCMEKDREKRYQEAEELLSELTNIEEGIPTTERVVPKREPKTIKIGEIKLKNLILYGGAAVLLILLIVIGRNIFFPGHHEAINSIAVLPLENISGDPEQDYIADGMTEELIVNLGKIGALRVISRQSVMQYKRSKKSLPEIARELNVDAVVEGTVVRSGVKVRITAKLIGTSPERQLWADTFNRDLGDVQALYSEVAQAIARKIEIAVTPQEQTRLASVRPVNPEAYDAYLMGRHYLREAHEEDWRIAVDYFDRACEIDPTFALGYAGLAEVYAKFVSDAVLSPEDGWLKVRLAAEKALEMDEGLSVAHNVLAWAKFQYDFDWHEAESGFKLALRLDPNNSEAHQNYSYLLEAMGRHNEAISQIKLARKLDPHFLAHKHNEGWILSNAGHYDEAHQVLGSLIDSNPEYFYGHWMLAFLYASQGKYEEAISPLQTAMDLLGDDIADEIPFLGYLYGRLGRKAEARKLLEQLDELAARGRYVSPVSRAQIYIGLGEKDKAFELLDKGYKTHSSWLPYIKTEFFYDSLRDDPRFKDLLRRMNLLEVE